MFEFYALVEGEPVKMLKDGRLMYADSEVGFPSDISPDSF